MGKQNLLNSVSYNLPETKNKSKILKAIKKIERKHFVENIQEAYLDTALSIGFDQTISQPSTVARMLQLLEPQKSNSVLEIGTGSGWNAALLTYLVKPAKVITLEIVPELAQKAKNNLKKARIENVEVRKQDFKKVREKFDRIIFTAGILEPQEKAIENFAKTNLKEGGILVCPFQLGPLIKIKKSNSKLKKSYTSEEYAFVPLA